MAQNTNTENLTWLYDTLTKDGVELGTFEQTAEAIRTDEGSRRWLYDTGVRQGIKMGSYEEFEEAMGLPKFQAPLLYGETPKDVKSAQPAEVVEEDLLTSDMPEEEKYEVEKPEEGNEEPTEEYGLNRDALKSYVPEFKSEIKEKFPNARLIGFTNPGFAASAAGIDPYLTGEERQKKDALAEQLKLGQINKEQYQNEVNAVYQQAADRFNADFSDDSLNASAALHLMTKAQNKIKMVDSRTDSKVGNFFRGVKYADYAGINPAMQFVDAYQSFSVLNKLADNPDAELSESEEYLLQAIVTNNAVDDNFQANMAERIGQGLPQNMAYMAQFALTGGAGSLVGGAAKKGVQTLIKKGMKNAERRLYAKGFKGLVQKVGDRVVNTVIPGVVGASAAAATQTVLDPIGLASGTLERAAGTAEYGLTADGAPVATGEVTDQQSLGESFKEELLAKFAENVSERSGESLGVLLGGMKAVGRTAGKAVVENVDAVRKVADKVTDLADMAKKSKVGDMVGRAANWLENKDFNLESLARTVGWNGTVEEFYEEQVNTVLNAMLVGDEEFSSLMNSEKQLETLLSVGIVGGSMRLLSAPAAIADRAKVRSEKQNLKSTVTNIEKRMAGNQGLSSALKTIADAVDNGTVEDIAIALAETNRQLHLDRDTAQAFLDYASARSMLNMWRSNDRRQASKLAEEAYAETEARTHKQTGAITVAEYTNPETGNVENVDIIDGVIIRNGQAVDSTLSDRSVVVRMQDGSTKMVPSKTLGNVVQEINPVAYRSQQLNDKVKGYSSEFSTEYSSSVNKYGVHYNDDGTLDYYNSTPGQIAVSLVDEKGGVQGALEYAAEQQMGLQGAQATSAEGGEGFGMEQANALSKWQTVEDLLSQMAAKEAETGTPITPEEVTPAESAEVPAKSLRPGDRVRLTVDSGEVVEATIGARTPDGEIVVDFDEPVSFAGNKGQSLALTPEQVAAAQYVEQIQEGEEELEAEQSPELSDVDSFKSRALGRIPVMADGSRDWEAATPMDAATAKVAELDGDFDAALAFAQEMAENTRRAAEDLSATVISVDNPADADALAAAKNERSEQIASMQKTSNFWQEVANNISKAKASSEVQTAETAQTTQETTTSDEEAMPKLPDGEPDFVSAGVERTRAFLNEQLGEAAVGFVQTNIAEAEKALAEATEKKPTSTGFLAYKQEADAIAKEREEAQARLDFWAQVATPAQSEVVEEAQPTEVTTEVEEAPAEVVAEVEETAQPEETKTEEEPITATEEAPEVVEETIEVQPEETITQPEAQPEQNKGGAEENTGKDTNFVEESETTPQETIEEEITTEMIENSNLDEEIKLGAIAYLNGDVNMATELAYEIAKNYVRNNSTERAGDSTNAGSAQLGEGVNESDTNTSEQSRGNGGDLDSRENDGTVSDSDGVRSETGENDLAEPSGSGSDRGVDAGEPNSDEVSGGSTTGSGGSSSDSERRPTVRNTRRRKGSGDGLPNENESGSGETKRGGNTPESASEVGEKRADDLIAEGLQELKDIFANPMGDAKGALLDATSLLGMFGVNAIKIMGASAKIGIGLIQKGYYKLKKWRVAMHDQLDEVLRKNTQLTDELIDDFINAMWDYPFRYRGEVRKISEWASLLEAEELRAMMRMSIEEKRKLQQNAESEPTILADIDNIRKSLPFLLPAQQEDVEKAEFQFFDESHKDAAYGYGKGYMFTNGTGTGKTYTGLGIIKRFIKQGKGRILIVTASGEKIDDWVKDAKNLGITATRLADTKSKGEGVVVTQFANLRQNYELLKDEFDLIVYDESHKLMENQGGLDTRAAAAHYMIANRDVEQAIARTLQDTPLWKEPRMLEEELDELTALLDAVKMTSEQLKRAEQLGGRFAIEQRVEYIKARLTELVKLQEAEIQKQLQDPAKRAEAEAAVARTKVVFLSATPFNTALNLDYVEGYIFSYPTDESGERDREKDKERFIMDKFPSSHRRGKNTVVRMDERNISDPDAVTAEEIAFSDYLQNTLHTMSGRGLDSEWDYSREFPKLSIPGARLVNAAIAALTTGKYNALRPYFKHLLDDYAQSTAFFEVIKTSASIERIREHIALGRKVVVFHRRMTSTEPMEPPFAKGLENADYDKNAPAEMIARFRQEFAELLAWEQSLDYRFPQEILTEAFASEQEKAAYKKEKEEYGQKLMDHALGTSKGKKLPKAPKLRSANVGVFNGQETAAERHKAVEAFNTDGSKCNLLVVQVAAGKEGISLHDKTGKHQRVMMSMQLPQSPIEFVQAEGRIYRVGNQSNAIFEYPLLGIDQEVIGFAAKINGRAATTENLALGSRARGLRNSISRAVLASREIPVTPTQGVGGKQLDSRDEWEKTDYDGAIAEYNARASEEKTTDFNEQETPEPIGYKMMEWARAEAGESILEPAAGTGTMAQYAPQKSRLTAIEIITQKFATLITKIGGSGRKLLNEDFMGFSKNNKFDCVVMNSPHYGAPAVNATIAPQGVPQREYEFLEKAFGHINEGGRVVALLEEKSADATIEVVTGAPSRVLVGEVKLPAFAFPNGKAGVATRVVVFDVVSNATLREAMPEKVTYDLSNVATPQDLFKALRDVQMPARTIDKVFRLGKKMQKFEAKFKEFKNFIMKRKNYFTGKMEPEVDFTPESAYLRVRTAQGSKYYFGVKGYYFRLQINGARIVEGDMDEISRLCKQYQDIKSITDLDPVKDKDEFRRLTSNGNSDVYPEISEFLKVCQDAIRTALGKTESQIKNIAEGRVENELRGDLTLKQMKDAFEGLSHGDVTLEDLSKKVFEAVGKIEGLRFYTKQGMNPSEVAYYSPRENAIAINEDTWNSLRWSDSFKAQTVVHEMIHAVTSYYIHAYELGASFSEEINQACQDILEVYKAISTDEGFRAGLRQRSDVRDNAEYGLTSATEMIAELANPLFRAQLKVKKLWRQLVNGIKKLLGINPELGDATETTALETLESALDTLLSNYDPDAYAAWVEVNRGFSDSMEVRDMMTSEQISADYPNWLEGTTTDSGKHTTQVEGTRKTYRKVGKWIAENMGMDTSILDASSGMGYGTQDLRAEGFNVEDVEPYQSESRKQSNPATYSSYDDIEKEYDFIISNAVLNVIPDDWRADVLHNMAAHLKEGGKMLINTRKAGEEKAIKDKIELDSAQEVLVKRNGQIASYQKFFTPSELKEYVESELGEGYTVEVANLRNSGTSGLAAVVVTKNKTTLSERSGADSDNSSSKGLLDGSSAHLSRNTLAHQQDVAKIRKSTQITKQSLSRIERAGGSPQNVSSPAEAVRLLGRALKLQKAPASQSYYGDLYEGDFAVNGAHLRLRVSTHPANGRIMGNVEADHKVSVVILKNGEHRDSGPHNGYEEYIYDPKNISLSDAINAVLKGVAKLLETGQYEDVSELAVKKEYPTYENGDILYRTASDEAKAIAAQAETLSRAEVEGYAKSLAEVAPEGVKVVVTNSAESGDTEHAGWYDMSTDTVYINADLCENEADVDATFAHELVGHRAMPSAIARVIGRRNVTDRITLYTKLAMMLPQELLDRVMAKTADNMDLGTAVDEVLAEEVENANIIKPSLWRRICAEVRALFRKVLNRGLMMSDNDIKYMFWLAANNINNDAEYLKADEVLHRIGAGRYKKNSAVGTEEQKEYDEAVVAKSQRFVENWVDSLNPVKKLQEAVAKAHGPLKPFENAYDIELGRASRTMARFNMMAERYLKPVITAISSLTNNGTTLEDVKNYMIAKHGLERNAYYREEKRQELNKSILDFIKEVATDSNYSTLSIPEKVAVVKNQFDNISAHIDFAEVANALEFAKDSPGVDYMGNVVSIEAVPLKDMSGLTGLTEKLAPHLDAKKEFTSFAESLTGDFEALYITSVDTLWEKVRDLSTATLLYQVEGGIISREQYNHLRSMYKYYIPLRGWDGENSSDFYEYSTTPSRYQTVVKSASGRESLADDPLANLANMLQSAVTIVEKNAAKQALVRMAMNRPDSNLVKVVRVRYEKRSKGGKTVWEPVYPDIPDNATPSDVDSIIEEFEEETKQLVAAKEARVRRSQIEVGVRVLPTNKKDHYVKAMFNGEEVAVVISGSPAAALALNGLNAPDYDRALEETLGRATRFFAKTHTTWAPKFVLTNFMRDFGYGSFAAYTKYGARYAAAFEKNIIRAGWKLPRLLANGMSNLTAEQLDDFSQIDQQTLRYFVEFLTNGGETGFSQALSTEEWKKKIESQIRALQGGSPKNAIKGLLKLLESANRYAEDIPRFAAYLTSRESGKGIPDSIKDAKEITVNFSRHGAGGMGNSLVRKSYAFVNAGIQGAYNLITLAKENPQRFWPAVGAIFLSGFAIPFLNMLLISAFGDDDDERNYKYMTEFNNTNRLVIFNPLGEKHGFITLPISHELVPFYGLGNIAARRMMGMDADLSLTEQVASAILSIAPLDFISSSTQGVNVRSVIPSAVQPVYDIFENKDYMGRPIYRSYDYGSGNTNRWDAAFTKAPVETWSWLVELSRLTSMATGGDGIIKPGMADFHLSNEDHDVQLNNPAIAQYLVESYLGGSVQSVTKVINLGKGIIASLSGDETNAERYLAAYNLPLVSGLYRFSNETSADSRINQVYDHYKNDIAKQCEREIRAYMDELPADMDAWPKAALDVLSSEEYKIFEVIKAYDKHIRKGEKLLRQAYNAEASKDKIDSIKRALRSAKQEVIEQASAIRLSAGATQIADNN